ncbi:Eco57I restriction-modification methylase domain-containing protein, partial [Pseudomonas sp. PS02285]|uniref:Eco57I restriction-modification methylase domain-containing protein n=1 Tax=Pseudomonas sp. PS02285 TaxID=2991441 RepID=UPI00249C2CFE
RMLADRRIRALVDFPDSRDVFGGVDIAGGVSYFLWDVAWNGECEVTTNGTYGKSPAMNRYLDEYDIFVRYNEAISILHRVLRHGDEQMLSSRVAPIQPFGLRTNY